LIKLCKGKIEVLIRIAFILCSTHITIFINIDLFPYHGLYQSIFYNFFLEIWLASLGSLIKINFHPLLLTMWFTVFSKLVPRSVINLLIASPIILLIEGFNLLHLFFENEWGLILISDWLAFGINYFTVVVIKWRRACVLGIIIKSAGLLLHKQLSQHRQMGWLKIDRNLRANYRHYELIIFTDFIVFAT
jgi:hypothetical protein